MNFSRLMQYFYNSLKITTHLLSLRLIMRAKVCSYLLILLFIVLQYGFWLTHKGSIIELKNICKKTNRLVSSILELNTRYDKLLQEIQLLKTDISTIEELARYKLGFIKPGEEYCQIIEPIE